MSCVVYYSYFFYQIFVQYAVIVIVIVRVALIFIGTVPVLEHKKSNNFIWNTVHKLSTMRLLLVRNIYYTIQLSILTSNNIIKLLIINLPSIYKANAIQ